MYGQLKFESGVHRVQRVPATESSGRVHTSAASVAVMPQADEVTPLFLPDLAFTPSPHTPQALDSPSPPVLFLLGNTGIDNVSCVSTEGQSCWGYYHGH